MHTYNTYNTLITRATDNLSRLDSPAWDLCLRPPRTALELPSISWNRQRQGKGDRPLKRYVRYFGCVPRAFQKPETPQSMDDALPHKYILKLARKGLSKQGSKFFFSLMFFLKSSSRTSPSVPVKFKPVHPLFRSAFLQLS